MSDDLRQLRSVLRQAVAASRLGARAIERAMGLGNGNLERLLDGTLDLRVRHLVGFARALQVPVKDFLELGCPEPPGGARFRLRDWVEFGPPAQDKDGSDDDLAALIRAAVREELARIAAPSKEDLVQVIRDVVRAELSAAARKPPG
jgi:hypothetical protein